MVKAVFDELAAPRPRNHFTVGIVDDVTHTSLDLGPRSSTSSPRTTVRAVFFGLGADGTVGANKNSIKIIGEETRPLRPGLLRLRLEEVRRGHGLAPALRPAADPLGLPDPARQLRRLPPVRVPRALRRARARRARARCSCSTPRCGPARSGTACRARCRRRSSTRACASSPIDAYRRGRARPGMGGRINTVMQTCFFALSGVLPRDEAIAQIKKAIEKTYGKRRARRWSSATSRPSTRALAAPPRGPGTGRAGQPLGPPPAAARRRRGARLRAAGDRGDARRQGRPAAGQRLPRGRHLADRHRALGEAQHRAARSRSGTRTSASSATSARLSARTRRSAPRSTTRRRSPARRRRSCPWTSRRREFAGLKYTLQVAPEDCTGCNLCVEVCPAKDKREPAAQGDRHGAAAAAARARAGQLRLLPRSAARSRPQPDPPPGRQGLAVPAAALRVLRRLRRAAARRPTSSC